MNPVFLFALLIAFLSGCKAPENTLPYPLSISENGLGSIHADTPIDLVESTLSGFTYTKFSQITPEHPETILQLKRGNNVLAHIVSDPSGKKISTIIILSPLIKNSHHQGIGEHLMGQSNLSCNNNECFYADEPSVRYKVDTSRTIREILYQKL